MSTTVPMTPPGLEKLHRQLRHLLEVERPQNVRDIEVAREHGDLRENAEYHAAKERQGQIDGQMKWLENLIASAQVIDPTTLSGDRVVFGATVTLIDIDADDAEPVRYKIVGEHESDLSQGLISFASPIARALIGKSEGDEVTVRTPGGQRVFEIDSVDFI
ncbi:MAG: transcription elongation factor GreA [Deltaproteobacteria bacterium]|nr:transcription elongation factor GreA [Deltaproteobacteria bacterium]